MARDIDRVIDYIRELERERFFPPVMAQVMVNRLDTPPTPEEREQAKKQVFYGERSGLDALADTLDPDIPDESVTTR